MRVLSVKLVDKICKNTRNVYYPSPTCAGLSGLEVMLVVMSEVASESQMGFSLVSTASSPVPSSLMFTSMEPESQGDAVSLMDKRVMSIPFVFD